MSRFFPDWEGADEIIQGIVEDHFNYSVLVKESPSWQPEQDIAIFINLLDSSIWYFSKWEYKEGRRQLHHLLQEFLSLMDKILDFSEIYKVIKAYEGKITTKVCEDIAVKELMMMDKWFTEHHGFSLKTAFLQYCDVIPIQGRIDVHTKYDRNDYLQKQQEKGHA